MSTSSPRLHRTGGTCYNVEDRSAVTHESIRVSVVALWRSVASSGTVPRDEV